jgi:hypothetical protein
MRAKVASTMLEALLRPAPTAATISATVLHVKSSVGISSTKHRRSVDVVGQREFVNDLGVLEQHLQIERYGGAPSRIDRQRERLRVRRDEGVDGIGLFGARGRAGVLARRTVLDLPVVDLRVMTLKLTGIAI